LVCALFGYLHTEYCCAMANSEFFCAKHFSFRICHGAAVLHTQVPNQCTDLHLALLYILTLGTHSKIARETSTQRSVFASRRHARALVACLPHQNHVYITTNEVFCFHNDKFDEMPCKLDPTENLRSFEKYTSPP
jgi:hypothetical protein